MNGIASQAWSRWKAEHGDSSETSEVETGIDSYVSQDSTHCNRCENLKSNNILLNRVVTNQTFGKSIPHAQRLWRSCGINESLDGCPWRTGLQRAQRQGLCTRKLKQIHKRVQESIFCRFIRADTELLSSRDKAANLYSVHNGYVSRNVYRVPKVARSPLPQLLEVNKGITPWWSTWPLTSQTLLLYCTKCFHLIRPVLHLIRGS
jgi:hypothetical protein